MASSLRLGTALSSEERGSQAAYDVSDGKLDHPGFGTSSVARQHDQWVICGFSVTGVVYDLVFVRRVYLASIIGALLINLASPLRFIIADTHSWREFAPWITR